ncbi:MAG TPA: GNAT family N-acetyltransferase [Clostridiales bacterium]|jgi:ribosomal-protein-alanine N-acetyltransferase|nr:GNAT family N-acetyltransferase [Clostridiales bacterium]
MINHIGTKPIDTERLHLRRYKNYDAEDIFNNWATDAEVTKYLQWLPHKNIQVTRNILDSWINAYDNPDTYNWAIEFKENGQVVNRVQVFHHAGNTASGKVMQKAGMRYEGCLRQYKKNNQGVLVDCETFK